MSLRRSSTLLATVAACVAALAMCASSATALEYTPHELAGSFDGSDSTGGGWGPGEVVEVAADKQTGNVYVITTALNIYKFNAEGEAMPFTDPSLGGSTFLHVPMGFGFFPEIAVDNSGGPRQGRIYVTDFFEGIWAYEPSGAEVGGNFPVGGPSENLTVDPATGNVWDGLAFNPEVLEFTSDGDPTGGSVRFPAQFGAHYVDAGTDGSLYGFTSEGVFGISKVDMDTGELQYTLPNTNVRALAADQVGGNLFALENGHVLEFTPGGDTLPGFPYPENPSPDFTTEGGLGVNGQNGYVYIAYTHQIRIFKPKAPVTLPDAKTTPPTDITPETLVLHGSLNPAGVDTSTCEFEYGPTTAYGSKAACEEGQVFSGNADQVVSAAVGGLKQGSTYHYRLVVGNANGVFKTADATFFPSAPPSIADVHTGSAHSDSAVVKAFVTPGGAPTTFHVDFGTADCLAEPAQCASTPESATVGAGLTPVPVSAEIKGLEPETTYHYVIVATNQSGTVKSGSFTFTTFPFTEVLVDECDNAHVRQQTGAALLLDCRAYELVSAANAGGYDVESYLTSGQSPFGGFPRATDPPRVLYGVHDGAIPGAGRATNFGLDPYVATRGAGGWSTSYVGIPADLPHSATFASTLAAANDQLDTFAFGGPDICSPCFEDGSTGVPVRTADGSLVQGMAGPATSDPAGDPEMLIKKPLSADGTHLVFGSSTVFVEGAGVPAIYDRDLATGDTYDVSRLPNGSPIPCVMHCDSDGLAELDISADGSRIVIGQLVAVDGAGNRLWHLYMNVGDADHTIDLMPGASPGGGALYGGMTSDGSSVYLTSREQLSGDDSDTSADVFRADVDTGSAELTRISTGSGGAGDTDACIPVGNSVNTRWNAVAGAATDCSAVAIGGGGGVAEESGAIYFLSPELLDGPGNGTEDAPNLYLAERGSAPRFVVTLESSLTAPAAPLEHQPYEHGFVAGASPEFVATDISGGPSDGSVYVADTATNVVRKFDSDGNPVTSWGNNGVLEGSNSKFPQLAGIAVGPTGQLYVAAKIKSETANDLFVFGEDGTFASAENLKGTVGAVGVAVDAAGSLYFVEETLGFGGSQESKVFRRRSGTDTPISTGSFDSGKKKGLAVDPSSGDLYVNFGGTGIGRFIFDGSGRVIQPDGSTCDEECDPTTVLGTGTIFGAGGLAVDPLNGDVFVDLGSRIVRFDSNGRLARALDVGADVLSNSTSVALGPDTSLYANTRTQTGPEIAVFSPRTPAPRDPLVDNPLVADSVNDAATRHTADFEVTPDGGLAAFSAALPFTGYDNAGFPEIFRFDADTAEILCVSCNPTNARAVGAAEMASNGLSLTDDGRLFFTTTEPVAPRDLDGKKDVYEWSPQRDAEGGCEDQSGCQQLISTGVSQFDSILLSASRDGVDAYFFTRDNLASEDLNGQQVKIYDARAGGGFPFVPPRPDCKASDECHGAGSQPPAAQNVNSGAGTSGNSGPAKPKRPRCKRGFVRRHGKCVKRKKQSRKHHHQRGDRGGR